MKKLKESLSLTLVLVTILSLLGLGAFADGESGTAQGKLNVTKTIGWDTTSAESKKNATVTITSDVPVNTGTKVLFLGTLCGAHLGASESEAADTMNSTLY